MLNMQYWMIEHTPTGRWLPECKKGYTHSDLRSYDETPLPRIWTWSRSIFNTKTPPHFCNYPGTGLIS